MRACVLQSHCLQHTFDVDFDKKTHCWVPKLTRDSFPCLPYKPDPSLGPPPGNPGHQHYPAPVAPARGRGAHPLKTWIIGFDKLEPGCGVKSGTSSGGAPLEGSGNVDGV